MKAPPRISKNALRLTLAASLGIGFVAFSFAGPAKHELEILALTDPQSALSKIPAARALANDRNDQIELSAIALAENNACRVVANWPCQLRASQMAVQAARLSKSTAHYQKAMVQLARAQINLRDFTNAERTLADVRKSLDVVDEREQRADLFLAYSALSMRLGRSELSMQYARDGVAVLRPDEYPELRIRLLRNLVQAMTDSGEYLAARPVAEELVQMAEKIDDPKLQAEVWQARSRISRREHDPETTSIMATRIRKISTTLQNSQLSGMADEIEGYAEVERRNPVAAISLYERARESFARLGFDRDELRVARILADMYVTRDDKNGIVRTVQRLNELSDRIAKTERQKAADDFDEQLNYARQEFEVAQLNSANLREKARVDELRKNNVLAGSLTALSLCALIALGLLYVAQKRTAKRLEATSREKQNALMHTSHDIRNPINGILGITDLLLRSSLSNEQNQQVRTVRDAGRALQVLAQDLLDRGRLEEGKLHLNYAPTSISSMLEGLGNLYRARAAEKGLSLQVRMGPHIPHKVLIDEQRLHQVLSNLIGNALKFTSQGQIEIGLSHTQTRENSTQSILRFEVRDTGPGIGKEDIDHLFKPFEKGRHGHEHGSGAGLGLSISHDLVLLMGGRLQVNSKPGEGSCFFFELTIQTSQEQNANADLSNSNANNLPSRKLTELRVLVVDDDPVNRLLLSTQFESVDCTVSACSDARSALETYSREPFDLVVLDYEMPEKNGAELAANLRSCPHLSAAMPKIIMISGHNESDRPGRHLVDLWVTKPFDFDHLLVAIQQIRPEKAFKNKTNKV